MRSTGRPLSADVVEEADDGLRRHGRSRCPERLRASWAATNAPLAPLPREVANGRLAVGALRNELRPVAGQRTTLPENLNRGIELAHQARDRQEVGGDPVRRSRCEPRRTVEDRLHDG